MEFLAVCLAILLWLVRPQDWVPGLEGLGVMTYVMLVGILSVVVKPGGTSLKTYFKSPIDVAVILYLGWIVWNSGDWFGTAKALIPYAAFYYITVVSLSNWRRLSVFLNCWVAGLFVVAILALSSVYGFELAEGTESITNGFKGRLALNTWIYNNPNSLGHGVVVLIAIGYVWWVWRRPLLYRLIGVVAILAAGQTVYETQSKGAYLSGAAVVTISLLFKRSRLTQAIVLGLMLTGGVTALKMLPRMDTMDSEEGGIAGRLVIWQLAYNAMETTVTGEGWKEFEAWFETEDYGLIRKATHGSYVNVGADLGYVGLFLFLAILYGNLRTIWMADIARGHLEAERVQRALLCLAISFVASAWMIDRAYHTDYFILAGACGAFYRLLRAEEIRLEEEELEAGRWPRVRTEVPTTGVHGGDDSPVRSGRLEPAIAMATAPDQGTGVWKDPRVSSNAISLPAPFLNWPRIQLVDIAMCYAIFWATLYIWQKVMTNFISF